jgi:hypothetical protein
MRASLRAIVIAVGLVFPSLVNASELQLSLNEPSLFFGPAGAVFDHGELPGFDRLFIDGVEQETPWFTGFQGKVDFMTGPLESLTVDDSNPDLVTSQYVFGPGTFTLTANWVDQFFNPVQGHYVAPLLSLMIDIRCEQELSALDCGDVWGGSLGDAFVSIGPGLFDDSLASILHLKKSGGAFQFEIALDGITGNPSDAFRLSGSAGGSERIAIPVEVPEPSILSLLLLAPVLSRRFRKG